MSQSIKQKQNTTITRKIHTKSKDTNKKTETTRTTSKKQTTRKEQKNIKKTANIKIFNKRNISMQIYIDI